MAKPKQPKTTSHDVIESQEARAPDEAPRPLTVREAGRKGGGVTAARYGPAFFQAIGRKGGGRVRELIARAQAAEAGKEAKKEEGD